MGNTKKATKLSFGHIYSIFTREVEKTVLFQRPFSEGLKTVEVDNKTIIEFVFRMISRIIQTSVNVIQLSFASADNNDLGLNNS